MTVKGFLNWEAQQGSKYEFDGSQPVPLSGVNAAHSIIQANLLAELVVRMRGHHCRPHGSDLKIQVAGRVRYADAFIADATLPPGETVVRQPLVVFEILGPGTSYTDRIEKNREYRATASIRRYVILEPDCPAATVYARDGGNWVADFVVGAADLELPEVDVRIPLADLYDGVPTAPAEDDA